MEEFNIEEYPNLLTLFGQYQEEVVNTLKQRLEQAGRKASGQLINNISTNIKTHGTTIVINLISADYIGAVTQKGRKPTEKGGDGTLRKKIEKWLEKKGIEPTSRVDKNGKTYLPTQQQLAYLISRKIHQEGNKLYREGGDDLLESVLKQVNNKYIPLFTQALERDFNEYYSIKILKDVNKILYKIQDILLMYWNTTI